MKSSMIGWSWKTRNRRRTDPSVSGGLPGAGELRSFQTIQALRAVAALMVVIYHMVHAETVHGGGVALLGGPAHFGYAGVDVFFVISGFIMATVTTGRFGSPAGALDFLCRRAIRIFPLYWLCTLAIIALMALRPDALSSSFGDSGLIRSLLLVPQEGGPLLVVGWTLTYELFFYAMTALALAVGSASRVRAMVLGWAAVLLLLQAVPTQSPWANVLTSPLSLEFMAGALAGLYWRKLPDLLAWPAVASGIAWMVAAGLLLAEFPNHGQSHGTRVVAFGLPSTLLIIGLARMEAEGRVRPKGLLVQLGNASYSLYLTHLFVLSLFGRMWSASGHTGTTVGNAAFLATTLLACCALALFVHQLIEVPLMHRANRAWRSMRRARTLA